MQEKRCNLNIIDYIIKCKYNITCCQSLGLMEQTLHQTLYNNPPILSPHSVYQSLPPIIEQHSCTLDQQYHFMRQQIINSLFFSIANKHTRIKISKWVQRLDNIRVNKLWKANRNNYIKLLNLMCHCQYLSFPFNTFPDSGDLATLKKHQINQIIDEVQRGVKKIPKTCNKKISHFITQRQDIKCSKIDTMTGTINESTRLQISLSQSDHLKKNNLIFNHYRHQKTHNQNQIYSLPKHHLQESARMSKSKNIAKILRQTSLNQSFNPRYSQNHRDQIEKKGKLDFQQINKAYFSTQLVTQRVKEMTNTNDKQNRLVKKHQQKALFKKNYSKNISKTNMSQSIKALNQQKTINLQEQQYSMSMDGSSGVRKVNFQWNQQIKNKQFECGCQFLSLLVRNRKIISLTEKSQ